MDVIFHTKVHLPGTSYHDCTLDMLALSSHLRLSSKHMLPRVYCFSLKLFQNFFPFLSSTNSTQINIVCACAFANKASKSTFVVTAFGGVLKIRQGLACSFVDNHEEVHHQHQP